MLNVHWPDCEVAFVNTMFLGPGAYPRVYQKHVCSAIEHTSNIRNKLLQNQTKFARKIKFLYFI
jgi:hypothetical protein